MSTYSTNLGIELIGTGEQDGTWGTTTNTNLGTLIEQAISGYTTYACTGGTDTITIPNGASGTARNMFLELTGTGGGTLVVPQNKKLYFVYNNTASAITVKVSGQTGVSVAAGNKVSLVCNGTDVVSAVNFVSTASVLTTTVNSGVTGTTQAYGTNNTTMATTAFVQAAMQAIYPVGSIYTNATNSTNPATLLGFGTWTAFGAGRVPVGFNAGDPDFDQAEETGGSKTHSHTNSTASDHTHSVPRDGWGTGGGGPPSPSTALTAGRLVVGSGSTETAETLESIRGAGGDNTSGAAGSHTHTISTSSNLSPYITVYMWKRTA